MALTHRVERIQEQVREEVSQMLATEVRDPGVGLVTVTRAKVTGDLSLTRIYWTILGDAAERKKTVKALERATGFVRHLLAERLAQGRRHGACDHVRRAARGEVDDQLDRFRRPRLGTGERCERERSNKKITCERMHGVSLMSDWQQCVTANYSRRALSVQREGA